MNLKEFTETVDSMVQQMNLNQLQLLLHSIARKVPEGEREDFMEMLSDLQRVRTSKNSNGILKIDIKKVDDKEIRREMDRLKELFLEIENGEITLEAYGYEDYSLGYGCDNWVWEYNESDEIRKIYEDSCRLLVRCVNDGFYHEALELFECMNEAEVMVEDECDGFSLGINELREDKLISVNLENLALYVLYAAYQEANPKERVQNLYSYFSISFFKKVSLENMLSLGKVELENLPEFWDEWISYLMKIQGNIARRLLEEAIIFQRGEEGILPVARLACETHPSLYLTALQSLERLHDIKKLLEIGKEAVEKVNSKYVIRSEIALKTAEAAFHLNHEEEAKSYLLEAFRSNMTPVNYLRLIASTTINDRYREIVKKIIFGIKSCENSKYDQVEELTVNFVSVTNENILRFFERDFDFVMKQCSQIKKSLGWSSTFMECGLSFMMLLLLNDEDLKQGCKKLAENVQFNMNFDAKTYYKGTKYAQEYGKEHIVSPDDQKVFWQCFTHWKSEFSVVEEQAVQYLTFIEKIIDKRINAIIGGQFRRQYNSVAALAAALGEVKESRGDMFAKERILQSYRTAFPRHSSFHAALREYGMQGKRKV